MKLLCSSGSLAFSHSLRIALDGEGIETYCSDADNVFTNIAGGSLAGSAARIYVLHEEDWERAVEIMNELAGPTNARTERKSSGFRLPTWVVVCATALVIAVLARLLAS